MNTNWSLLPAEILSRIFQLATDERQRYESRNFTLVCKNWLLSAQLVLYSTININSLPKLKAFYGTVESNTQLGEIVKAFYLRVTERDDNKWEVYNVLTLLLKTYLPNLEELNEGDLHSYASTLDALLDGGLKKLKVLYVPGFESTEARAANYITCVLLMQDRLENLMVSDNFIFVKEISTGQLYFNRLYNKLDQFNKIKSICVDRETNDAIQVFEDVVGACKSLKDIEFFCRLTKDNSHYRTSSNSTDGILEFVPANNINELIIASNCLNDRRLLVYLMHKFPGLYKLSLDITVDDAPVHLVNHDVMNIFLKYLSSIDNVSVYNMRADNTTIADSFGKLWKATSKYGSKHVEFIFIKMNSGEAQTLFDLKWDSSFNSRTSFKYYFSHLTWNTMNNFTSENGKFIRKMRIAFEKAYVYLEGNFLQSTFTRCPNLQHLHFQQCILKKVTPYVKADFSKRLSLHELYLDDCKLYIGQLERWSLYLLEIKILRFRKIKYFASETQPPNADKSSFNNPAFEIVMPSTKIALIVFDEIYPNERICLKLFVFSEGIHYYYQYNPSGNKNVTSLTKTEYKQIANKDKLIYVCCLTKPDFCFT